MEAKIIREKCQGVSIIFSPCVSLSFKGDLWNDVTCLFCSRAWWWRCLPTTARQWPQLCRCSSMSAMANGKGANPSASRTSQVKHRLEAHTEPFHHLSLLLLPPIQTFRRSKGRRRVRLESTCSSVILWRACVHSFGSAASCLLG